MVFQLPPAPVLSDEQYQRYRDLIQERTGLFFGTRRRDALAQAVHELAQKAHCSGVEEYYAFLIMSRTDGELWGNLVNELTICETYFFRDPAYIEALRAHILPGLIERHQSDHTLRIWSAGCSTGEEPYTLAILLKEILPDLNQWKILILATDINREALQHAREARYRSWSFRQTDEGTRGRYFVPDGDGYRLKPDLREMVTFSYLNQSDDIYPSQANQTVALDLILWRNVSIYLPEAVIRQIANRFYQCLAPDGWLIVGPSETHAEIYHDFQPVRFEGAMIYQKSANASLRGISHAPKQGATRHFWDAAPKKQAFPALLTPQEQAQLFSALPAAKQKNEPPSPAGGETIEELFRQGEEWFQKGQLRKAEECFRTCVQRDARHAAAFRMLSRLAANRGQLAEAKQWAERCLQIEPLAVETLYLYALICQEMGDLQAAVASYKKVLYLNSDFILAHFGLAALYQQADSHKEAQRHRLQAIRLASRMPAETVLPGSDDLTAGALLQMIHSA